MAAAKQNKPKEVNLLLIIVLFVLFIAIAFVLTKDDKDDTSVSTTAASESTELSTEAESTEEITTESNILSSDDILDLFTKANDLYVGWVQCGYAPKLDSETVIKLETDNGSHEYARIIEGKFTSVDELKEELQQYFSAELYEDEVNSLYTMQEDQFYGSVALGAIGDLSPEKLTLTVTSATEKECKFSVTLHWAESSRDTEYSMQYIEGKWIFIDNFSGNFGLYFDKDIPIDIA